MGKRKVNKAALMREFGVSRPTLIKWEKQGLDLSDRKAVEEKVAGKKRGGKAAAKDPDMQGDAGDSESNGEESFGEANARWKRAQADKVELEVAKTRGELVSAESILSAGMRAGLAVRQALLQMESELTPKVVGLPSGKVAKVIRRYARDKLHELRDLEYVEIESSAD